MARVRPSGCGFFSGVTSALSTGRDPPVPEPSSHPARSPPKSARTCLLVSYTLWAGVNAKTRSREHAGGQDSRRRGRGSGGPIAAPRYRLYAILCRELPQVPASTVSELEHRRVTTQPYAPQARTGTRRDAGLPLRALCSEADGRRKDVRRERLLIMEQLGYLKEKPRGARLDLTPGQVRARPSEGAPEAAGRRREGSPGARREPPQAAVRRGVSSALKDPQLQIARSPCPRSSGRSSSRRKATSFYCHPAGPGPRPI